MEKTMMRKLLEAGVSADIVLKLHMEDEAETIKPAEPEPKEPEKPAADPVLAAIERLTGAIQAGNIRGTYQKNAPLTTDEILGTILRGEPDEAEEKQI